MDALDILPMELWEIVYAFLPPLERHCFGFSCRDFFLLLGEDKKIVLHLSSELNDNQLKFFGSCKSLVIRLEDLTGEQLKYFSGADHLDLGRCITLDPEDIALASLQCTSLSLYGESCLGLSVELIQLTKLILVDAPGDGAELEHLTNLEELALTGCDNFTGESVAKLPKLKRLELVTCPRFTQRNFSKLTYLTSAKSINCGGIFDLPKGVEGELRLAPHLESTNNFYMRYHIDPYSTEADTLPFVGM